MIRVGAWPEATRGLDEAATAPPPVKRSHAPIITAAVLSPLTDVSQPLFTEPHPRSLQPSRCAPTLPSTRASSGLSTSSNPV